MDFSITEEQKNLRDKIVRFAQQELNEGVIARDNDQAFSCDLWRKCAEMGIQGLPAGEAWRRDRGRPQQRVPHHRPAGGGARNSAPPGGA